MNLDLHAGLYLPIDLQCSRQFGRTERRHQTDSQRYILEQVKIARRSFGELTARQNLLQVGPNGFAETRKNKSFALPVEQGPTQLLFQFADGRCQRWLRDIKCLGGPRKAAVITDTQEISDLVHLHVTRLSGHQVQGAFMGA